MRALLRLPLRCSLRGASVVLPAFVLSFAAALPAAVAPSGGEGDKVDFVKEILPILEKRCFECHAGENDEGDLLLDDRANVFSDDWEEPVLKPGDPEASTLYQRIVLPADDSDIMPAEGSPLSKGEIAKIKQWIVEGASWPEGAVVKRAKVKAPEILMLPARAPEADAAIEAAAQRIREAGGTAIRVASKSNAYYVNLSLCGASIDDGRAAELLAPMRAGLAWLNLSRTKISDAGVAMLGDFAELRRLHLANTAVGDAAMETVAKLQKLEYLNLYNSGLGDAGLARLEALPALRKLFVWQTEVSDAGLRAFRAERPQVAVDRGEYVAKLRKVAKEVEEARLPVNVMCPVMPKRKANPEKTFRFRGQLVALCCDKCRGKFSKNPEKYWPQVVYRKGKTKPKFAIAAASAKPAKGSKASKPSKGSKTAKPVKAAKASKAGAPTYLPVLNAHCPVSGQPVDLVHQLPLGDAAIAFCCGKCKAAFAKKLAEHPRAKRRLGASK